MIEAKINEHELLELWIYDKPPTVYLDHWAIMEISASPELSARLVAALQRCGGTLAISGYNLLEFIRVTNRAQVEAAEDLVELALPNVVYIDCDPFRVIGREDELMRSGPGKAPHIDYALGDAFFRLTPESLRPYTARGLFSSALGITVDKLDQMSDRMTERLDLLRRNRESDPLFQRKMDAPVKGTPIQRGTRYVLREVVRNQLRDESHVFTRNDAMDLMHTVVPVSYCNFVLLDAHWCAGVHNAEKRIRAAGLTFPIAACFTGRNNGLERFLDALEKHPSPSPSHSRATS